MGSYAQFEHYLTTLEMETRPEFWPPTPVFWPTVRSVGAEQQNGSEDNWPLRRPKKEGAKQFFLSLVYRGHPPRILQGCAGPCAEPCAHPWRAEGRGRQFFIQLSLRAGIANRRVRPAITVKKVNVETTKILGFSVAD